MVQSNMFLCLLHFLQIEQPEVESELDFRSLIFQHDSRKHRRSGCLSFCDHSSRWCSMPVFIHWYCEMVMLLTFLFKYLNRLFYFRIVLDLCKLFKIGEEFSILSFPYFNILHHSDTFVTTIASVLMH